MTGPIRPDEVQARKTTSIPSQVFEIFNDLIARAWNGRTATVKQEEVVERLLQIDGMTRERIFDDHLLDVEGSYREQGWTVVYDNPSYGEAYPATFKFTLDSKEGR